MFYQFWGVFTSFLRENTLFFVLEALVMEVQWIICYLNGLANSLFVTTGCGIRNLLSGVGPGEDVLVGGLYVVGGLCSIRYCFIL